MLAQASAAISASRNSPAPKCGTMNGTCGNASASRDTRERIAEPQIEPAGQPELLAERRPTARRSARTPPRPGCGRGLDDAKRALVVQRHVVHGGEQAEPRRPSSVSARPRAPAARPPTGSSMKKPTNRRDAARPPRRPTPRRRARWRSAPRGARRSRPAPAPSDRPARPASPGIVPLKLGDTTRGRVLCQSLEERRREEMAVGVVEHQAGEPVRHARLEPIKWQPRAIA